ncbi:MAG: hypothetical protein DRP51_02110 [Candidatus Zixiibacteriota bacterium]|nr:MAG: hypothetical protein DRP51_02110 [candidate division Zixibacteria bacterium]HHI03715.1 hypothetical protein [candidate division Zixibacteria bacterium]
MTFRFLLFGLILSVLIVACDDEYYGPTTGNGDGPSANFIETDVSLSPDREYIYFSVRDTIFGLYSGLFKARVTHPIREEIYHGEYYKSPTINFDNNILAFLFEGRICYYDIAEDTMKTSGIDDQFESILYVNLDVLLAARNDSIFLTNEEDSSYQYLRDGWDPTLVAPDTFLFIDSSDNYTFHILKDNLEEINPETLYTIITGAFPRWPTLEPNSGHLAYGIEFWDQKFIYSGVAGESPLPGETLTFIDSSEYSKPYILSYNQIIFSGPDGSLYQSDFKGAKSVPFIHTED